MASKPKRRRRRRVSTHDTLLKLLQEAPEGTRVSSSEVIGLLGGKVGRESVHKAAVRLRREGYALTSQGGHKGGYTLKREAQP